MAQLPDPTDSLSPDDRAAFEQVTSVRARNTGRHEPAEVYVRMFNNPGVARAVAGLGEQLRFHGVLPDRQRELAVLRFAGRRGATYEQAHHAAVAERAGIDGAAQAVLARGGLPDGLVDPDLAVVEAVDATMGGSSIPTDVQDRLVAAFGTAGVVEVVALCGLYGLMADMVTSFDIPLEPDLAPPGGP